MGAHPALWLIAGVTTAADGLARGHWLYFGAYIALAVIAYATRPAQRR